MKPFAHEISSPFLCPGFLFGCFFAPFSLFLSLAPSVDPLFFQLYFCPGLTIDQSGTKIKLKKNGGVEKMLQLILIMARGGALKLVLLLTHIPSNP